MAGVFHHMSRIGKQCADCYCLSRKNNAMEKYPVILAIYEADLEAPKILEADK